MTPGPWMFASSAAAAPLVAFIIATQPPAPPVVPTCSASPVTALGTWDDVHRVEGERRLLLRRGSELLALDPAAGQAPRPVLRHDALRDSAIVASARQGAREWLFVRGMRVAPFAVDARSGRRVVFERGADVSTGADIQSHVVVPHAGGAILMVAGGAPATWPRPQNRPLFYWFGLQSGRVRPLPIGWDLSHFTPDMRQAVFQTSLDSTARTSVDMSDGTSRVADDHGRELLRVPFDWTRRGGVAPVVEGTATTFAGVSHGGVVHRFSHDAGAPTFVRALVRPGRLALTLRDAEGLRDTLWWMPLESPATGVRVSDGVGQATLLGSRFVVYERLTRRGSSTSSSALLYDTASRTESDLLAGLATLPPLDAELEQLPYITDTRRVRFVPADGDQAPMVVLLAHDRLDARAFTAARFGGPSPADRRIATERWRRALLMTAAGSRCQFVLESQDDIDEAWLDEVGTLVMGHRLWADGRFTLRLGRVTIRE